MTSQFDTAAYLAELRDNREFAIDLIGQHPSITTYREALRFRVDAEDFRKDEPVAEVERTFTANDLYNELTVAAANAYTMGATRKQIGMIVGLAKENNEVRPMGYTVLTSSAASSLIKDLIKDAKKA